MKKPKIRFKGYQEDWEQRKLGELGSLKNGMNFSKEAMGIGFPFVNLQNIFGNNVIDVTNLGKAMASDSQLKDYNLLNGDVLFVRSSVKLEGVGEAALVPQNLENTTYSGFIIRFRDEYGLDNNFKRFLFGIESVRNQIMAQATNSANKNISQTVLENLCLKIPNKSEQEKIGLYFSNLDHLITLHQRKCEETKTLKKYMLQKMFPQNGHSVPEIRFSGFTEDWEQRKLGDAVEFLDTMRKPLEGAKRIPGPYPYYGASGIVDYVDGYLFDEELILLSEDGANITDRNYPVCFLASGKYWVNNHAHVLRTKQENENNFICNSLERKDYTQYNTGMAMPKLNKETCKKIPISCPGFEEQKKIGDYFRSLDHLITLHQQKCDELRNIKKFMLQNMFI